jgi:uncharacterized membrane protein
MLDGVFHGKFEFRGTTFICSCPSFIVRYSRTTYLGILLGTVAWCSAIVLAPVFAAEGGTFALPAEFLYRVFHPICHQLRERSFTLLDQPFTACVRCSTIYFAFLAGTLLYPIFRKIDRPVMPPRLLLVAAALPMLVDAFPVDIGLYEVTHVTRMVTGGIFGLVLPFFILPAAIEAVHQILGTPRAVSIHDQKGLTDA